MHKGLFNGLERAFLLAMTLSSPCLASVCNEEDEKHVNSHSLLRWEEPLQNFFKTAASTVSAWAPPSVKTLAQATYTRATQWLSSTLLDLPPSYFAKSPLEIDYRRDKHFWLAHFSSLMEELKEEPLSAFVLQERLIVVQAVVFNNLLSPFIYDRGVKELQSTFPEHKTRLKELRRNIKGILKNIPAFAEDWLQKDTAQQLKNLQTQRADTGLFLASLRYYQDIINPYDYKQNLIPIQCHLQRHKRTLQITKKDYYNILNFINTSITHKNKKARALIKHERYSFLRDAAQLPYSKASAEELLEDAVNPQEQHMKIDYCYTTNALHFLKKGATYAVDHPFQTLTLGLAMQISAAAAIRTLMTPHQEYESINATSYQQRKDVVTTNPQELSPLDNSIKDADEFRINTYTKGDQQNPSVSGLTDGGFIVTWQSNGQNSGSLNSIYGQRYDNNGTRIESEVQVNSYTNGGQQNPSVSGLLDGGYVVVWQSMSQDGSGWGIYGQRYDNTSMHIGEEFQINNYTASDQQNPSVNGLLDGGFVVAWQSSGQDGSSDGIYGQRYDNNGILLGNEFQVNSYTKDNQAVPSVGKLLDGGFVVTWQSVGQDGDGWGIYGQRFNSNGEHIGKEFLVNTYTTSDQVNPSVSGLNDGNFVITWMSQGQDGSGWGIYGQRYDNTGVRLGSEFQINTYTSGYQQNPSVSDLSNEGFVVTWQSSEQDGNNDGIYGQQFDSKGASFGKEFQVNTYTTNDQSNPSISSLTNGRFVVAWQSYGQDNRDGNTGYGPDSWGVYGDIFTNTTNIGIIVGPVVGGIALIGIGGGIGAWKYIQHKKTIKEREQFPLASRLKEQLKLDTGRLTSESGQTYIKAVELLSEKLATQGIDVKTIDLAQLEILSTISAKVIKESLSLETSPKRKKMFVIEPASLEQTAEELASTISAQYEAKALEQWETFTRRSLLPEETTVNIEMHSLRGSLGQL